MYFRLDIPKNKYHIPESGILIQSVDFWNIVFWNINIWFYFFFHTLHLIFVIFGMDEALT